MENRPCFFHLCSSCVGNQCVDLSIRFDCEPNINGSTIGCGFHKYEGEDYSINEELSYLHPQCEL